MEDKKEEQKVNILSEIQRKLKCGKGQHNSYADFNYRSLEDILTALKPFLAKYNLSLVIHDDIKQIGDRFYVESTASLRDSDNNNIGVGRAFAREMESKKKMDDAQVTGAASSYARKYALNGLLCIDNTKDLDPDGMDNDVKYYYDITNLPGQYHGEAMNLIFENEGKNISGSLYRTSARINKLKNYLISESEANDRDLHNTGVQ